MSDPVQVNYRMAYVGTFALHDAAGAVLVSRRFAATAAEGPDDVIMRGFAEVAHARATRPTLPVAIVQDGAPELWDLMTAATARHGVTPAVELIDRYHLDAHIAALLDRRRPRSERPSVITPKPATRDRLKTGHVGRSGTGCIYCGADSLGKVAA